MLLCASKRTSSVFVSAIGARNRHTPSLTAYSTLGKLSWTRDFSAPFRIAPFEQQGRANVER
jgi:hypothetical protein